MTHSLQKQRPDSSKSGCETFWMKARKNDAKMMKSILVETHAHFCDCCNRVFDCGDVECGTVLDAPCRNCIEVSILRLERVQRGTRKDSVRRRTGKDR
jgi:hypothetical protein